MRPTNANHVELSGFLQASARTGDWIYCQYMLRFFRPLLSKAFSYSVAKAGVSNLTQNLAREWGTQGVSVNVLSPRFFPTEWSMQNFITPDRQAAIFGHTPMKRYGRPEKLVGMVLWLLSEAARFYRGRNSGGWWFFCYVSLESV